ncbi:5-(carboxyamino)imidazole ribonucleotide synthase [Roseofilum casamattae]|uniref:N5-carboxyaminoimidazole ribonucleotide synthase n=1 Tax=Roseofilum casamattae BLCC-M143 TaxID=3022442 RepID=A0ABT7BWZ5_9CYAN|nr:5-(carboxyamino)imidazole ribonucleotide synthase [Roseofilum casamattae]MDJ1183718.1 5-(carboxyamino)imidazole ribonucleotide synthase [Roseofilum casamattae BLCC-M143]
MRDGQIQRLGIIGGGQLAWMMALEGRQLGIECVVQTPKMSDPAVAVAADVVLAPIDDAIATEKLSETCDLITFENEFIDLDALGALERSGIYFCPSLSALQPLLDKYEQRSYLQRLGIPVPSFEALDWNALPADLDFPLVLKTRRQGYDGQGTVIVKDNAQLHEAREKFGNVPLLREAFVPFDRELAVMAARFPLGEIVIYPVVETQQIDRVCRWVLAPARVSKSVVKTIESIARKLLEELEVIGIFGIEFFLTADERVLVNEIAPRTHNSGHFSLDACQTSQFAQHLRAVGDYPPGDPSMTCTGAVMVNLLGYETSDRDYLSQRQALAEIPGSTVHWYGKTESRVGRKLGHVTVCSDRGERDELQAIARQIESLWYPR